MGLYFVSFDTVHGVLRPKTGTAVEVCTIQSGCHRDNQSWLFIESDSPESAICFGLKRLGLYFTTVCEECGKLISYHELLSWKRESAGNNAAGPRVCDGCVNAAKSNHD